MMSAALEELSTANRQAAAVDGAKNAGEVLSGIRQAFELFDSQSALLQRTFEDLKGNLARANRELHVKNIALSTKVEELQQMSSRLHCILESLADGVLVVNDEMVVERCNPAAETLLGLPREAIEGRRYADITNGLGNPEVLAEAVCNGRTRLDEQRSCGEPGREVVVMASVAPIRSYNGSILGAVEVLRDVTEMRRLEERMHHQKRMVALGEMAAGVAHEIRNPLGTIEGFARLLRSDLQKENLDQHLRLASKIIEGAQNLNYVITNLLTYARPMSLQCELFQAETLLQSVQEFLSSVALQQGVALDIRMPERAAEIQGDIRQLRQVLINLGRNAIESCEKGGRVSISVSLYRREAVLVIADNGCGIPEEDQPRIFDPFFTRKEGGTGLGLSLCHKIVAAHGGNITVNSVPGKGTLLRVVLPQTGDRK